MTGPRLADAFRSDGGPEVTDGDFLCGCTCGLEQRLDASMSRIARRTPMPTRS